MEMTFAEMSLEHIDQVVKIEEASFPTPWSKQAFIYEVLHNSFARYIVALSDEKVIGYAGEWLILDEAHITNVAVHPGYRRQGVGRALMLEIMRYSALSGATRMTLEVRPSNGAARRLYQSLGFSERGLRRRYYTDTGEDAIIMWHDDLLAAKARVKVAGCAEGSEQNE
ncbi:MAG: ribosomal protein S18-alanine N-acetyltransferase [Firmicutes bacterium]|nr:ribosomal protein S18-alanine N-acetyltransferase [Bacillota bacterium]